MSTSTVVLPCAGQGIPPPSVQWLLDGRLLDNGNVYQIEPITSSLIVPKFDVAKANFSCTLRNSLGTISSNTVIVERVLTITGRLLL